MSFFCVFRVRLFMLIVGCHKLIAPILGDVTWDFTIAHKNGLWSHQTSYGIDTAWKKILSLSNLYYISRLHVSTLFIVIPAGPTKFQITQLLNQMLFHVLDECKGKVIRKVHDTQVNASYWESRHTLVEMTMIVICWCFWFV